MNYKNKNKNKNKNKKAFNKYEKRLVQKQIENCFFDNEYFLLTHVNDVNAPNGS